MAQSLEMQTQIQIWREKATAGTLTQADMRDAIAALRADRVGAQATSTASKARKSATAAGKKPVNSDDLLSELDGM